jgi:hypothetical protein
MRQRWTGWRIDAELRKTAGLTVEFYRKTEVWVVDFTYDGRPRRWLKPLPAGSDARARMEALVGDLYGRRSRIVDVRPATPEEESQYIRGDLPRNVYCPTGRGPARDE